MRKHFKSLSQGTIFGLSILLSCLAPSLSLAQTNLSLGDLAFVHFDRTGNPDRFSFIARTQIDANTVFYLTSNDWNSSNNKFDASKKDQAAIRVIVDQALAPTESFTIAYGNGVLSSSTVSASYIDGNNFVFSNGGDKIWVYQASDTSKPLEASQFVTGILWKASSNQNSTTPGDLLQNGGPFLFDLDISGSSAKCGCISNTLTSYPFSDISFLYDNTNFTTTTSNASSSFPCAPNAFFDKFKLDIALDRYRLGVNPSDSKGAAGAWRAETSTGNDWTSTLPGNGSPDWANNTAVRRVELYEDLTLGSSNAAFPLFLCAELYIHPGVSLTLEPGAILSIGDSLDNQGTIVMSSGLENGSVRFAQIAPSTAMLNGNFQYDVYIANREWHHMISPIKTRLSDISFFNADALGAATTPSSHSLSFQSTTRNIFKWDAANAQWQVAAASDSFHLEPYTLFFPSTVLPLVMRVSGSTASVKPDLTVQKPAQNGTGNTSSPGFGAPGWRSSNTKGWNFYGNPYLSFISSQRTLDNYQTDMDDVNHTVYGYQPYNGNVANAAGNYLSFNGSAGDPQANFIPPFQAFFMQHIRGNDPNAQGSGNNNKGLKLSKRSRLSSNPNAGDYINFKKGQDAPKVMSLALSDGSTALTKHIYLDLRKDMLQEGRNSYKDGIYNGDIHDMFAIYYDSTGYTIKAVPDHVDSMHYKLVVVNRNQGRIFTIANHEHFHPGYDSFLYDRYTRRLHNLNQGPYNFQNDTTQQDYRFDWFISPKSLANSTYAQAATARPSWVWWSLGSDNKVTLFTQSDYKDHQGHVEVYNLQGRLLFSHDGQINQLTLTLPNGVKQCIAIIDGRKALHIQCP